MGLCFDEMNQRFRIGKKFGFKAISFGAEPSQNPAPDSGSDNGNNAENFEVHAHDSRGNRNEMPDYGQKPCKENAARFVASEPTFRLLQFFWTDEKQATVLHDEWTPD